MTIIDEMALVLEPVLIPQPVVDTPGEEEEVQAMKAFRSALGVHESRNWEGDLDKNLKTLRQAIDNLLDDSGGSTQFVHDLRTRLMGGLSEVGLNDYESCCPRMKSRWRRYLKA